MAASVLPGQAQAGGTELSRWQALHPTIEKVLKDQGYQCPSRPVQASIVAASEFHTDKMQVALVDFCPSSAYTEWIVAMRLKSGHPVPLRSRRRDGEIHDLVLGQGSSTRHGVDARLIPEQDAVQDIQWAADRTMHLTTCTVDVYVWDANSKRSDWNARLTDEATQRYCPDLQERLLR